MRLPILASLSFAIAFFCAGAAPQADLPKYETKYYVIHTDLDPDDVHEAAIRVTKMAEVYAERTRGFSGVIRTKFPFVLFKNLDDYQLAGGPVGSAGVFNGSKLMAVAGEKLTSKTWHVVQHEGFHQFAHAVIGGDIPVWVNEGLAEYFGEGLFTGDDMITGIIPEWRRARIVKTIEEKRFKPIDQIMRLTLDEWNAQLDPTNYDQAWSMVQFLAHGDGGKYQPAFINFMNALGKGKGSSEAWRTSFGDSHGFEERWKAFWTSLPENPTDDLYRRATLATLTSFVGRAFAQKQDFESMPTFTKAASENMLKSSRDEALPRSILASAMRDVKKRLDAGETFSIEREKNGKLPQIVIQTPDGKRLVGRFTLKNGRVAKVIVED
ncbi:MAG: DUF1570 domain-containing protein [Anaerolineae bacterium]|nr:DUF1570 domain-containing protein [Phycisphaerae bacterium]